MIHNNKYDYTKTKYEHSHKKVKIICSIHGIFDQEVSIHLFGSGCPNCSGCKKLTTTEFIKKG